MIYSGGWQVLPDYRSGGVPGYAGQDGDGVAQGGQDWTGGFLAGRNWYYLCKLLNEQWTLFKKYWITRAKLLTHKN